MSQSNKPTVIFAPGAFDHLEIESQEELDAIVAELKELFENSTFAELMAQSQSIDLEDLEHLTTPRTLQ